MYKVIHDIQEFLSPLKLRRTSKICFFSGAGMSAESGIATFRDQGGLWEQHPVEEVATPQAWQRNRAKVLEFYNLRRRQLLQVKPNTAHKAIAELEQLFDVQVITQNIDDLHERAGSQRVLHLHGELRKARSTVNPDLVYSIEGGDLDEGDLCALGSQLRPHVVWFGEEVPAMIPAVKLVQSADLLVVIGSSLNVYPAAGLLQVVADECPILLIDPGTPELVHGTKVYHFPVTATEGLERLMNSLGG